MVLLPHRLPQSLYCPSLGHMSLLWCLPVISWFLCCGWNWRVTAAASSSCSDYEIDGLFTVFRLSNNGIVCYQWWFSTHDVTVFPVLAHRLFQSWFTFPICFWFWCIPPLWCLHPPFVVYAFHSFIILSSCFLERLRSSVHPLPFPCSCHLHYWL